MEERKEYLDRILRAKDIMQIAGLSPSAVYNLFHEEGFPVVYLGKSPTVRESEFWAWYDARRKINATGIDIISFPKA